jgi:predicted metal-dependent phosphoesterase TrpH
LKPGGIDLHVHTNASDGTLSPRQIVQEALARGVTLLGIADHDTVLGLPEGEAAAREVGITMVPAVELSVETETREIHVLGYFVEAENAELREVLSGIRERRNTRNDRILEQLKRVGAPIDPERLREIAGEGSVGRPHIALALVEAGHVVSPQEAFDRFLADGRPAFVPRARLGLEEACGIIRKAGGLPVLAHPAKLGSACVWEEIVAVGIDGVEVYHSDHNARQEAALLAFAKEMSLLVTGGTDTHGWDSSRPLAIGSVTIPEWVGEELLARAPEWWTSSR